MTAALDRGADASLSDRLSALGERLLENLDVLHERPFVELPVAWERRHPEALAWVLAQPPEALEARALAVAWDDAPAPLRGWGEAARRLTAMPALPTRPFEMDLRFRRHLPDRKVAQVESFVGAVAAHAAYGAGPIVDWCAGKGHLGRAMAQATGRPFLAVERDAGLCESGAALAAAEGVPGRFEVRDVLEPATADVLARGAFAVALHACGSLHAALIRGTDTCGLAVAPCCYDRSELPDGLALLLSRPAQALARRGLRLDVEDLRLLHERPSETGTKSMARIRQGQTWRLGFDAWHRANRGARGYHTMPPFPRAWLELSFPEFCRRFAPLGRVAPPTEDDATLARFEAAGAARLVEVRRRDSVRALFRRPLEVFLVLDRAVALVERGYEVQVGTFCDEGKTPRNLLIVARRP